MLQWPRLLVFADRNGCMKLSRIIVCLLAFAAPAFAARTPELTVQGLEQRVDFWKKVFTQYGKDDVVIHDQVYVNLIYHVASDGDLNTKLRTVRDALQEIRSNLETPQNFTPAAQQIRDAIMAQGIPLTASNLDQLSANIHT